MVRDGEKGRVLGVFNADFSAGSDDEGQKISNFSSVEDMLFVLATSRVSIVKLGEVALTRGCHYPSGV